MSRIYRRIALYLGIFFFVAFSFFPILWMALNSLKTAAGMLEHPLALIPIVQTPVTLAAYYTVLFDKQFIVMIMNSFIIGFSAAGLSLLIGTLTAYAMSRYHFRWRRDLAVWILSTRFFPAFATAIPLYFMFVNLGLLNNRFGLALVYAGMDLPFVVWNMKAFFDEVPFELDESALLDGCTRIGALFRVALPLAMAGLVATGIFCVIINWNEFAFGLILTSTAVAEPVTVGAGAMMGRRGIEWNGMLAGGVVAILPVVVFALIVQKYLVRGLTFGAVKGR